MPLQSSKEASLYTANTDNADQCYFGEMLSLHFARGIAEAICILVTAVCVSVCLSLAAFPHYCRFAIGAWVSLLWHHQTWNVSECLYLLYAWFTSVSVLSSLQHFSFLSVLKKFLSSTFQFNHHHFVLMVISKRALARQLPTAFILRSFQKRNFGTDLSWAKCLSDASHLTYKATDGEECETARLNSLLHTGWPLSRPH